MVNGIHFSKLSTSHKVQLQVAATWQLQQNTARKSEAVLVSDIQRAGVRLYVGLGARRGLIDIRQSAADNRATTTDFR